MDSFEELSEDETTSPSAVSTVSTSTSTTASSISSDASPINSAITKALTWKEESNPNLSPLERNDVLHHLLKCIQPNGRIQCGVRKAAADEFDCSVSIVARVWKRYTETVDKDGVGRRGRADACDRYYAGHSYLAVSVNMFRRARLGDARGMGQ